MRLAKSLILISFFSTAQLTAVSHEVLTGWELDNQLGDIKVFYRDVSIGDTLKTRQMLISFSVEASPIKIVQMFKSAGMFSKWSAGVKECRLLSDNNDRWTTYTIYDFPWPYNQEDLVTEYKMRMSKSVITLSYNSGAPTHIPYNTGASLKKKYDGEWKFMPGVDCKTNVEFRSTAYFRANVPHFIQDPIVQGILFESINNLKALLAEQEAKRIVVFEMEVN